ncbi:MAG: hypothetical protein AB7P76_07950 [Candidatus Melainabacteria bacterium]
MGILQNLKLGRDLMQAAKAFSGEKGTAARWTGDLLTGAEGQETLTAIRGFVGHIDRKLGSQWASELRLGSNNAPTRLSNFLRSNGVDVDSIIASHSSALTQTRSENKAFREAISSLRKPDGSINREALSPQYRKMLEAQESKLSAVRERLANKGAQVPQGSASHGLTNTQAPGGSVHIGGTPKANATAGTQTASKATIKPGIETRAFGGAPINPATKATATPHPQAIAVDPAGVATLPSTTSGATSGEKKSWWQRLTGGSDSSNPAPVRPLTTQEQALADAKLKANKNGEALELATRYRQQQESAVRLGVQINRQGVGKPDTFRHNLMTSIQERLAVRAARKNGQFKLPTPQELGLGA